MRAVAFIPLKSDLVPVWSAQKLITITILLLYFTNKKCIIYGNWTVKPYLHWDADINVLVNTKSVKTVQNQLDEMLQNVNKH